MRIEKAATAKNGGTLYRVWFGGVLDCYWHVHGDSENVGLNDRSISVIYFILFEIYYLLTLIMTLWKKPHE